MSKFTFFRSTLFAISLLSFTACTKDEDIQVTTESYKGLIVVNEGGFGKSNGSVGVYKTGDKSYFDAFKKANDRPLGDIVQSMILIGDYYYICVNNSNKIEVLGRNDFKAIGSISTASPRYILPVSTGKAYISNLYSNSIKVLNTSGQSVSSQIDIHHNSDQMALMDGNAYIATFDNKIMVVNTASDSLSDSISTPSGLSRVVNAGTGRIGVLCTGLVDWSNGSVLEKGSVLIINQDSNRIEKTVQLSSGSYGGSMVYSAQTGQFYFSLGNNIIYKMGFDGIVSEFKTLDAGRSVYSLTYNSSSNELYVTDAGDFNSAGKVIAYDQNGNKTLEFNAGIAPNGVLFNN